MTKEQNLPRMDVRLVVVDRPHDHSAVCRVQTLMRDGTWHTEAHQEWPGGRPTPAQLESIVNRLSGVVSDAILSTRGVQGVMGSPL